MTPDQLAQAIIKAILDGGEGFLEGTLAAALPIFWLLAIALHLARPYMLRTTAKFSLRLAADIWWVLYIGIRDLIVVVVFIMSFMFLFPDVVMANAFPITGALAMVAAFATLLTKLLADGDDDPRAFRLVSWLLAAGATLFILPTIVGVQVSALDLGDPWSGIAAALVTSSNQGLAVALSWISVVAVGVMGVVAIWFNLTERPMTAGRPAR